MTMPQLTTPQCFAWWTFAGRGLEDNALLRAAADAGYTGIEMLPPPLFASAKSAGLTLVTANGHESIGNGFNDPDQHIRIEREIRASLEEAVKHGIQSLIVFSGDRRPGLSDEAGIAHTVTGLRRLASRAEDAGVTLLLELLNSKVDHAGYQADHTAWGVAVCEQVNSPRVKLLYDIYHMQIMEGDIIRTVRAHHPHIGHYHTAGVPGRGPLGPAQELNYPAIMRAIRETGYTGWVGQEFFPEGDPAQALAEAYQLCAA